MDIKGIKVTIPLKGKDRIIRLFKYYDLTWNWGLQPRDFEVAGELFHQNFLLKKDGTDKKIRMEAIFSKENKQRLCKRLKMSPAAFANSLTKLRKVRAIKNNELVEFYTPATVDANEFPFKVVFNG